MAKTQINELVASYKKDSEDLAGNTIKNVLVKHNEFVIYEIDHEDINARLRVLINSDTDEKEEEIQERFNKVKMKYIEAKGMLNWSSNPAMMKHRIAHTLSTCLRSISVDGETEFDKLIKTITDEHESEVSNRAIYLVPCLTLLLILFVYSLVISPDRYSASVEWQVVTALLSSSLGCIISMLINAKTLNFEEYTTKKHYLLLGLERVILSFSAAAIAFIAIKSGVIFPDITNYDYWSYMLILVVACFSESLVPSMLEKVKNDA